MESSSHRRAAAFALFASALASAFASLTLGACAAGSRVTSAPSTEAPVAADPASASTAPRTKRAPTCDLLRELPAARELSRQMNGDVTILKYSVDFREHAQIAATALGANAGVVTAQPFIVFSADVVGPHGMRSIVARGVDGAALHGFQKYAAAGSLDALERADDVPFVAVGAQLADDIGAALGDEITLAPRRGADAIANANGKGTKVPAPVLRKVRIGALLRFPGETLTAFGTSVVLTTLARAAALDAQNTAGSVTGIVAWTDASHTDVEAADAITKVLANGVYRVLPARELDGGFRESIATLTAYCNR